MIPCPAFAQCIVFLRTIFAKTLEDLLSLAASKDEDAKLDASIFALTARDSPELVRDYIEFAQANHRGGALAAQGFQHAFHLVDDVLFFLDFFF